MKAPILSFVLAAFVAGGCATAGAGGGSGGAASSDRITAAEIEQANARTAYDAVNMLQPQWFRSRGPRTMTGLEGETVSVFSGGVSLGGPEALRDINAIDIAEIRYYPPAEAGARFGMGHPSGVIDVTRKGMGGGG